MKFFDYFDLLWDTDYRIHNLIDEMYWDGGCNTDVMFDYVLKCANSDGVQIVDKDTVDYDGELFHAYHIAEKGLS